MSTTTALLISDDEALIAAVRGVVEQVGNLDFEVAENTADALDVVEEESTALVVLHFADGVDILDAERTISAVRLAAARKINLVAVCDVEHAKLNIKLLRMGVAEVFARPLDLRRFGFNVDSLTVHQRWMGIEAAEAAATVGIQTVGADGSFLFHDEEMGRMMQQVKIVAPQETTILITGETGTGKTRMAQLIHELSGRNREPFMELNCGSLSANLIESEMFGHVRGAFTGADKDKEGKFKAAGRGTLLLDEVDALPIEVQVKLLQAVDTEPKFEPVGSNVKIPMQARLIVATNRKLEQLTNEGKFREDLYYRLNVVAFQIAPLRSRPKLIPELAQRLVHEYAAKNSRQVRGFEPAAMDVLIRYHWPGNIRQLRNEIERAVALCPAERISADDLRDEIVAHGSQPAAPAATNNTKPTLAETTGEAELDRIKQALDNNGNNRLRAAKELGISRVTFYKKLRKYGLMGDSRSK